MEFFLYCVYDSVACEAGPVWTAKNDGIAVRQYQHLLKSEGVNSGDYTLYCIGLYNSENLEVIGCKRSIAVQIVQEKI